MSYGYGTGQGYATAHAPPGGQHGVSQPSAQQYGAPTGQHAPPAGQYRPPPAGQYGAPPAAGQYGAPPAGQYQAQSAGQYGAPPTAPHGAPPTATHGAPPTAPHGAPPPGQYGAPPAGQYQPPPPSGQYGAPAAGAYNRPAAPYGAPPTAQGYGGYGGPPATPQVPPGVDPVVWGWFQSVDADQSGRISAHELQQALHNNNWSHFNGETCRLMIGMFDKDRSGHIDIHEFAALWKYVQDWKTSFDSFDRDRSGNIDANELNQAFRTFGYNLSPQFCQLCVRVFDNSSQHNMKLDDFIQCCVMLKTLTEKFRVKDSSQKGVININYEEFLEMVLDTTLAKS